MLVPLEVLLLLRIVFDFLCFCQINLRNALSMSMKKCVGILMGIALNLQIVFVMLAILLC